MRVRGEGWGEGWREGWGEGWGEGWVPTLSSIIAEATSLVTDQLLLSRSSTCTCAAGSGVCSRLCSGVCSGVGCVVT